MNPVLQNAASAAAIAAVIVAMGAARNNVVKAVIYCLPIPITVVFIATDALVTSRHIIGLFLLNIFLWSVATLYKSTRNILLADSVAAAAYIVIGYFLVTYTRVSFVTITSAYALAWLIFCLLYPRGTPDEARPESSKVGPGIKFAGTAVLSFGLLSMQGLLSGVVVTFPFSGVFAVIEGRQILRTMALTFTRNSLALLALFVTLFMAQQINLGWRMLLGWAVYLPVLLLLQWLFRPAKPS
jgi:hypothetical protein